MHITDLPLARSRTVAAIRRSMREAQVAGDSTAQRSMDQEARLMEAAELFWVTEEMAQVALDASTDLPPWSMPDIAPAQIGVIYFDGGLPAMPFAVLPDDQKVPDAFGHLVEPAYPVDWISWWRKGKGLKVEYGCHYSRIPIEPVDYRDLPLVPMGQLSIDDFTGTYDFSLNSDRDETDEYFDVKINLFAILASTFLLMKQESVAISRRQTTYASRADQRARRSPALITTVTLRRMKSVETSVSEGGRIYSHRWIVRGHWRQQPSGAGSAERVPTWIPSYIKGPPGAPLMTKEKVTVWRR